MKNKNIFHFIGKLIIRQDDKEILDKINLNRTVIEDGLVWEAWIVSFRIWLPNDCPEGIIDICYPVGEDNSYGFSDVLEANIIKDAIGVYRLSPRDSMLSPLVNTYFKKGLRCILLCCII